ncbi:MAG: tetratricopeptide repeat protein [Bacteroidales bacterium]|nr:tetratricopeptide repeat protein [Bacteroidales bacterium]
MNKRRFLFLLLIFPFLTIGCRSGQKSATTVPKRYERRPIVEVSEKQLGLDAALIEAKMQKEAGNRSKAEAGYRSILAQEPHYGGANYELSVLLMQMGRMDSALVYAERAVACCDTNIWYHHQLAQCLQLTGNYKRLHQELETIISLKPADLNNYYALSNSYLDDGNVPKAIEVINRVEKMVGVNEEMSLHKQRLWNAINRPDKALQEIEKLAQATPNDAKYNLLMANSYMNQKNYPKAKDYLDRAVAADPDDGYIQMILASYYKETGQKEPAYQALRKGLLSNAFEPSSKMQLLSEFYTPEEFYGSCASYTFPLLEELMAQSPDPDAYAVFYGDVLMRQERYPEAIQQFEKHLAKDSSDFHVWEALLVCDMEAMLKAGKGDAATTEQTKKHALRAKELFPLISMPYYALAYAYENEGNMKECYANYERILSIRSDDAMVLNSYAWTLVEHNEQLEKALLLSEKSVKLSPDDPHHLDTYAWILYKLGRRQEALTNIRKAVKLDKNKTEEILSHLKEIESHQ